MDKSLIQVLVEWFPMLLLVAVWLYFIWRVRSGPLSKYQVQCYDVALRQAVAMERIAAALEKRS